ncbi:MAG: hypothetical protein RLN89_03010 [Parvibaculum sp.]
MAKKPAGRAKETTAKSPVDRASDMARQIWLAGVGAYGQAVDETQEKVNRRVAQVSEDTTKFFEDLVNRGNDLEQKLGALGKLSADVRAEGIKRGTEMSLSMEDRLSRMRDMLGLNQSGDGLEEKVDRLAAEVASLSAKLDRLVGVLEPEGEPHVTKSPKAPIKKRVIKKGVVKKTVQKPKPSARKSVGAKKAVRPAKLTKS